MFYIEKNVPQKWLTRVMGLTLKILLMLSQNNFVFNITTTSSFFLCMVYFYMLLIKLLNIDSFVKSILFMSFTEDFQR